MEAKFSTLYGEITIAQKVILELAGNVATRCYGVVGMGTRNKKDGIVSLLKPDNMNKGIEVKYIDDSILINIHIIVQYGTNIAAVSESVVNRVRYSVESCLGVKIKRVMVKVEGIRVS